MRVVILLLIECKVRDIFDEMGHELGVDIGVEVDLIGLENLLNASHTRIIETRDRQVQQSIQCQIDILDGDRANILKGVGIMIKKGEVERKGRREVNDFDGAFLVCDFVR